MITALFYTSMAEAALRTCEIIEKRNATQEQLVPLMLDIIIKRIMSLKVQRIFTGGTVVYFSILDTIGKLCDEYQVKYGSTELGLIAYKFYSIDHKSDIKHEVLSYLVEMRINDDDKYI